MNGFNLVENGHFVNLLSPADDNTTAATSEVFSMENWSHASIVIHKGSGSASTIILEECTSFAGAGHRTFLPYQYAQEATAAGDTTDAALAAGTTAGVAFSANDGTFLIFEINAAALSDGYPYVRFYFDVNAASEWGAMAILSGGRYQKDINATAIA